MAENKLVDMSTEFAIQILKLTENIKGHYSLSNQLYCSFTNKDNPNCIFQVGDAFGFFFLYGKVDAYT